MTTPGTGGLIVHKLESMEGMSFGLKFFDDDTNLYVSPSVMERIAMGGEEVRYMVMKWRRNQITIEKAVEEIREQLIAYGEATGQL